jgi:hypothetical protein
MEEREEEIVVDDSNMNDENGSLNYDVEVSLEQDEEQSIISKLMEENPGMEEEDKGA